MPATRSQPTIVWFRQDLRVADHPALSAAVERGGPVVPLFIWSPHEEGDWPPGAASRWWLHHSLTALAGELKRRGCPLVVQLGPVTIALQAVIQATGADAVFWSRQYEPGAIRRDTQVRAALEQQGVTVRTFNSALLWEPEEIRNSSGGPFRVFTPFHKHCLSQRNPGEPLPVPRRWPRLKYGLQSIPIGELGLQPGLDWAQTIAECWTPGERGAVAELDRFIVQGLAHYEQDRNYPARVGTSRLSPHLHWGEISPRQVWHAMREHAEIQDDDAVLDHVRSWQRQLTWREFAYHLLSHFPHTTDEPLRARFARFPWLDDHKSLTAWQRGRTGYPLVDAGMRELWHSGWMHNRTRMVVASFLVKHLLIRWQEGARWFWDTLVDADLANNTLGWQWAAGCGADAAPYFRIFNPSAQAKRFDADGAYVQRWAPDNAARPIAPIVEHAAARQRALAAFASIRE